MKKNLFIIGFVMMLWASPALAQQATGQAGMENADGDVKVGYRWISLDGSARSGEYEYFQKSDALSAVIEWDRLPHRFMLEYHSLNEKDFFKSLDYSFSDVVVVNATSRRLFHNLDHFSFGLSGGPFSDGEATPGTVSFLDRNPNDQYGTENNMNTFFLRLKTPDFPFHFYAEARSVEKEGLVQQRFLLGYFGDINKVSESREIDWRANEVRVGVNSHLGPAEVDYSHTEKRFEALGEKVLYDSYPAAAGRALDTYPHNLVPDLESSSDTVKIHTSHTGRIVAAGTYTTGEKENRDSNARTDYWNGAGDLTITPVKNLAIFFKYRHYDLTAENPDTVTITGLVPANTYTYNVRDSISSRKDIMSGTIRYRATDRLTVKGEYSVEKIERNVGPAGNLPAPPTNAPADWEVAPETNKSTAKLSATYRLTALIRTNPMLRRYRSHGRPLRSFLLSSATMACAKSVIIWSLLLPEESARPPATRLWEALRCS
jgi:hypothetical protein